MGRQASRSGLPSSATFASRLALSAWPRSGLAFLRFKPWEPTTQRQAVGDGHAFQIGLFVGRARQVQQTGEREVAHLAEAQDLAPHGVEPAKTIQAADFVARHQSQSPVKAAPERLD